jgi:hypothetical protein
MTQIITPNTQQIEFIEYIQTLKIKKGIVYPLLPSMPLYNQKSGFTTAIIISLMMTDIKIAYHVNTLDEILEFMQRCNNLGFNMSLNLKCGSLWLKNKNKSIPVEIDKNDKLILSINDENYLWIYDSDILFDSDNFGTNRCYLCKFNDSNLYTLKNNSVNI